MTSPGEGGGFKPLQILSPVQMWQHVAALPQRFVLLGDTDHRAHEIMGAVTQSLPYLGKGGVRVLARESNFDVWHKPVEAFNAASMFDRLSGYDEKRLRHDLFGFHNIWDKTPARIEARRDMFIEQVVLARRHQIRMCPISLLDEEFSLLKDQPPAQVERLRRTNAYLQEYGTAPDYYKGNPILWMNDNRMLEDMKRRHNQLNFNMDAERAHMLQAVTPASGRGAILYGAGHFTGKSRAGIDTYLPADQQVYVLLVADQAGADFVLAQPYRAPDFVLRIDEKRAYVMPAADQRGLWPAPARQP